MSQYHQPEQPSDQPVIIENYRGPLIWTPAEVPANTNLAAEQPYVRPPDTRAYPGWSRWGGLAGIVGGVLWVILWILEAVSFVTTSTPYDQRTAFGLNESDYTRLFIVPTLLLLLVMTSFHAVQRRSYRAMGWVGFVPTLLLYSLLGVNSVQSFNGGRYLWLCSMPMLVFAQMLWGLIVSINGRPPHWAGYSLFIAGAVGAAAYFFTPYAEVIFGLPWIVIGYAMWRDRNASNGLGG